MSARAAGFLIARGFAVYLVFLVIGMIGRMIAQMQPMVGSKYFDEYRGMMLVFSCEGVILLMLALLLWRNAEKFGDIQDNVNRGQTLSPTALTQFAVGVVAFYMTLDYLSSVVNVILRQLDKHPVPAGLERPLDYGAIVTFSVGLLLTLWAFFPGARRRGNPVASFFSYLDSAGDPENGKGSPTPSAGDPDQS